MNIMPITGILTTAILISGCQSQPGQWSTENTAKIDNCTVDYGSYRARIVESIKARDQVKEIFLACIATGNENQKVTAEVVEACQAAAYEVAGVYNIKKMTGYQFDTIYANVINCGGK